MAAGETAEICSGAQLHWRCAPPTGGFRMGVLADWQIQTGIKIEPFAEGAARAGMISYGVTSYGYDVRVDRRFKVFTNARCTVVDPKNFDPLSFVDIEGDSCLIPPNSFALAETVEYLEIPRDVIGICLGKSTYARCFRGDTRVALVNGTAPTLEEMTRRAETGETFWGYSRGRRGRLIVGLLAAPRYMGRDNLVAVQADDHEPVYCTPDHPFLLSDGRMVEAERLRPGDSLMPLHRQVTWGCELVYRETRSIQATAQLLEYDRSVLSRYPEVTPLFRDTKGLDHPKIVAVRPVAGTHDVYCLTAPAAANFALEAGMFVHNCGIIVNVTPLEPEWRGRVTIEISNTTPLPAKIYAGEGIAQILFLRGDAVCRTSYADKKGKYQDQKGLTLPFVIGPNGPST
jgi:deoxycytidine triphosphate deaminase